MERPNWQQVLERDPGYQTWLDEMERQSREAREELLLQQQQMQQQQADDDANEL